MEKKIIFTILMIFLVAFSLGCTKEEPIDQTDGGTTNGSTGVVDTDVDQPLPITPTSTTSETVTIRYFAYEPNIIKVSPGTTIVFENEDGDVKHQVVSGPVENFRSKPDGLFESDELAEGDTWEYTFEEAGEYPFHSPKYTKMQGMVIVGDELNELISITTPHFVGSTPMHLKKLSSLNEIWITFNVAISNESTISVYDVGQDKEVGLSTAEVDSSNNLRLHAEFAEPLVSSLYKVSYTQKIPEGEYDGQFFFYIEE